MSCLQCLCSKYLSRSWKDWWWWPPCHPVYRPKRHGPASSHWWCPTVTLLPRRALAAKALKTFPSSNLPAAGQMHCWVPLAALLFNEDSTRQPICLRPKYHRVCFEIAYCVVGSNYAVLRRPLKTCRTTPYSAAAHDVYTAAAGQYADVHMISLFSTSTDWYERPLTGVLSPHLNNFDRAYCQRFIKTQLFHKSFPPYSLSGSN